MAQAAGATLPWWRVQAADVALRVPRSRRGSAAGARRGTRLHRHAGRDRGRRCPRRRAGRQYVDMLQIGTRNMQNFALLQAVAVDKPVMLKRGMNATIEEWLMAAEYIAQRGNLDIVVLVRAWHPHVREGNAQHTRHQRRPRRAAPLAFARDRRPVAFRRKTRPRRHCHAQRSRSALMRHGRCASASGSGAVRRPTSARQRRLAFSCAGGTPAAATDGTSSRHGCRASGLVQRLRDDFDRVVDRGVVDVEMRDQSKLLRRERHEHAVGSALRSHPA